MIGEQILVEIDGTLDQLIRNAEVIENVDLKELSETEIHAFKKTQESLLHHLIHLDDFFTSNKNQIKKNDRRLASFKIQEKLLKFEKLKNSYHQNISRFEKKMPILCKRRSKRFLKDMIGSI